MLKYMTRKDFNSIAAAFKQASHDIQTTDLLEDGERIAAFLGLESALDRIIPVLAASNPNFDRQRFITATLLP
jgi:hypothetical protein